MAEAPELPDPRPAVELAADGSAAVVGVRCPACGYVSAARRPWCPRCRGELEVERFGPGGAVWSSTVFRVPLPGRTPPYVLAYVDLDAGPRVLAHVSGPDDRPGVGSRVRIVGVSPGGDLVAEREGA